MLFAHGAGAGSSHPWMQQWKTRLSGVDGVGHVETFDYSYRKSGKPAPKAETLVPEHLTEARKLCAKYPTSPMIFVGKSMGSRVGIHAGAAEGAPSELGLAGAICFGYPLVGANGKCRDEILRKVDVPVLFIQGTRDDMCPIDALRSIVSPPTAGANTGTSGSWRGMPPGSTIYVVEDGDHSLQVPKKILKSRNETQDDVDDKIQAAVKAFVSDARGRKPLVNGKPASSSSSPPAAAASSTSKSKKAAATAVSGSKSTGDGKPQPAKKARKKQPSDVASGPGSAKAGSKATGGSGQRAPGRVPVKSSGAKAANAGAKPKAMKPAAAATEQKTRKRTTSTK